MSWCGARYMGEAHRGHRHMALWKASIALGVLLTLDGCAVPPEPRFVRPNVFRSAQEAIHALSVERLTPIRTEVEIGGVKTFRIHGYPYGQVARTLSEAKQKLTSSLQTEEGRPLLAYVDTKFPRPENLEYNPYWLGLAGRVVTTRSTVAAFQEGQAVATKVGWLHPLTLDLAVFSRPSGARVVVEPVGGGQRRTLTTNSEFRNLFRGLYRYEVLKAGMKRTSGLLDLVDDSRSSLDCELVPEGEAQPALPCNRR